MFDRARVEAAVVELINAIGEDPNRAELKATPQNVAEAYSEFFKGIGQDPLEVLAETIPAEHNEVVILKDIDFVSICEHHLLPFTGVAHIAYLPGEQVVGLGLDAKGVVVVVEARHHCVVSRGARQPEANTVTMAARGVYSEPIARAEVMGLISK